MPVLSTTAYDQTETALNLTRALINDAAGSVFNDPTLMPLLNSAYRALQRELAEAGVSVLVSQVDLDLPLTDGLTTTELTDTSTPQLPTDLMVPHRLWEQQSGSSDLFVPMEKIVSGLPNLQPGSFLRMWEWREDTIQLLGATSEVTVRLRYEKVLPQLVLGTDPILIRASNDALAYATAAVAARARGARALAADMQSTAMEAAEKAGELTPAAIRDAVKGQEFDAPNGHVKIEPENLHTYLTPRIAQWLPDGQGKIIDAYKAPVKPLPYVAYGETESSLYCTGKGLDTAKLKI